MATYASIKYDMDLSSNATGAGAMTLLATETASSDSTISFTSGIDDTYDEYVFKLYDIHPASESHLTVNFRDGGSSYDATKTSTFFHAYADEAGTGGEAVLEYATGSDLAQSTSAQRMFQGGLDNANDSSCVATMHLFSPSNTTFVKHFFGTSNGVLDVGGNPYSRNGFFAGYCNVTAAIDGVQFAMASGNIDSGTFKLYGVS
jgi:hypothetical protein